MDTKAIRKNSVLEKLFLHFEKYLIRNANGLVVLDPSGWECLNDMYKTNNYFKVIPTATDIAKYKLKIKQKTGQVKFVFLGGVRYP
mgnify:CR=1 FL=1